MKLSRMICWWSMCFFSGFGIGTILMNLTGGNILVTSLIGLPLILYITSEIAKELPKYIKNETK